MISPSLISPFTQRHLWHCGETTWLLAVLPPAAAIHQWPQLGGRMERCCMMQKCKTMPDTRRASWSTPLCFISSMSTSLMRGATSAWSQITLAPTTPTGPSLLSTVRMLALCQRIWLMTARGPLLSFTVSYEKAILLFYYLFDFIIPPHVCSPALKGNLQIWHKQISRMNWLEVKAQDH